jgi:prepilin-type N-terminal cleavage/methylation domain-containing protein
MPIMKPQRSGMSLFELIVVVIIIGVVYSLAVISLKSEKAITSTMSLSSLKTTLLSLSRQREIRMLCDVACRECRIYDHEGKLLRRLVLDSDTPIHRYGFNRFGELQRWGDAVMAIEGRLIQGCFEITLSPDGTITPLILKNNTTFYLYTPLGEDKPYVSSSEEEVRKFIFNESHYPLTAESFYGTY